MTVAFRLSLTAVVIASRWTVARDEQERHRRKSVRQREQKQASHNRGRLSTVRLSTK